MPTTIGILGAGGQASELAAYVGAESVSFYAVDAQHLSAAGRTIDVTAPSDEQRGCEVIAAVGAPAVRRELVSRWPGDRFGAYVSPAAYVGPTVGIGDGSIVSPGAVLTASVLVGHHVIVNVGASISHDVVVGDFATIGPGARIGGHCRLGAGVVIGIGAVVKNDVAIADGVIVGAGAVVVADVEEPNAVVIGNPARTLRIAEGWAREL
ncbi:hypothetical protein [Leifsonia poae]|uniref:Acetyltransferase n=1 Tax=Leifsonia poae TaxID=110933 RepID=A0A9W6LYU4_9MICO|nr:hypothetical protein [Leifsonia poae]GLJ74972.1 hypothetical protein GCM10017584_05450 [Leifsonia poae]